MAQDREKETPTGQEGPPQEKSYGGFVTRRLPDAVEAGPADRLGAPRSNDGTVHHRPGGKPRSVPAPPSNDGTVHRAPARPAPRPVPSNDGTVHREAASAPDDSRTTLKSRPADGGTNPPRRAPGSGRPVAALAAVPAARVPEPLPAAPAGPGDLPQQDDLAQDEAAAAASDADMIEFTEAPPAPPRLADADVRKIDYRPPAGGVHDPRKPQGPDPDVVKILTERRTASIDERRTKRGKASGKDGHAYTQSAATTSEYLRRARGLLKRYKFENQLSISDEDVDPVDFVTWFFSLRGTLSANSWRLYRASVLAKIEGMPHDRNEEAVHLIEADVGRGSDEARSVQRGRRTTGLAPKPRAARFQADHFRKMIEEMTITSRSVWVPVLKDWLVAGINTGLRPVEWELAVLETRPDPNNMMTGRRAWLHVVNAKATNGRGNGTSRTLDISDFSETAYSAVERMTRYVSQWSGRHEFEKRKSTCQQLCYEMSVLMFPRMDSLYSLYSARHQFIANMKAIYSREEVAALIGHNTVETQVEEYAKRRQAWRDVEISERPKPLAEQVAMVRKTIKLYDDRLAVKAARKALADRRAQAAVAGVPFAGADENSYVLPPAAEDRPSALSARTVPPPSDGT